MKAKKILSIILALVIVFSLTACGGSNGGGNNGGGEKKVSQGVTDTEVYIGTANLSGGVFAYIGIPAYDGLRAVVNRVNANGGLAGRQIVLQGFDDQYDAATGKAFIERFCEQDKVFAFCSLFGNIVEPSLDYLKEFGIPVINISSGLDVCYSADQGGNIFQVQPANMTDARQLIMRVLHEHIFGPNKDQKLPSDAKIGVLHGVDSASLSSLDHLIDQAKKEGAFDRLIDIGVTAETYPTAIQQLKNEGAKCIIFMGIDATNFIAAMDDARFEVPVFFSYGASTLQSFVPDTYKPGRPCYATIWAVYDTEEGKKLVQDMYDLIDNYLPDVAADEREGYKNNNYWRAGYAYGRVLEIMAQLYKDHPEKDLNWEDFIALMEEGEFYMGEGHWNYHNGKRMGVDTMALVEYIGDPATGEETMPNIRGFETLEEIGAK